MKKFLQYASAVIVCVAFALIMFYAGTYVGEKKCEETKITPTINISDEIISINPSDDEDYVEALIYRLEPVSTKYGIGEFYGDDGVINVSDEGAPYSWLWYTEHFSSEFLTIGRTDVGNDLFLWMKLSTKIAKCSDDAVLTTYDASVVFAFKSVSNNLSLYYSYVTYGDAGVIETSVKDFAQIKITMHAPNILTTNYSETCSLLSSLGFTDESGNTWKVITGENNQVYFTKDVLSSVATIVANMSNLYSDLSFTQYIRNFDFTNFITLSDMGEYDTLICSMNFCDASLAGGEDSDWSSFDQLLNYYTYCTIPFVNVEC